MDNPAQKRILIIDDDLHFSQVLARSLERQGHQTAVAASGDEALQAAQDLKPQWVTLDLRLEQESGLGLIGRLEATTPPTAAS